jgi:hypothetical protein
MTTATPDDTIGSDPVVIELWVLDTVYEAALTRAEMQGERLAAVARAALFTAAAAAEPVEDPQIRPRPYNDPRKRVRFKVPAGTKRDAVTRIEASGESVPAAIERYLREYVKTGTIARALPVVVPVDEDSSISSISTIDN